MRISTRHAARFLSAACAFVLVSSCTPAADDGASGPPVVEFRLSPSPGSRTAEVNVYPLSAEVLAKVEAGKPSLEDWQRILAVRVRAADDDTSALPLLGGYGISADTLRFRARFAPASGVEHVARFDGAALYARIDREAPPALAGVVTETWRPDAPAGAPSTFVRAVYPTRDVLPMNLLRMYVEFSAPMSSGHSYDFIKVYAMEGDSLLDEPFFTAGGAVELWDPEHTRLTILFDPGRIKRDLRPHEERGLPLREGKRYRLVIDSAWRDAEGRPLVRSFTKEFRVGPQDRALVRTADWRLTSPRAGTRDSLVVTFPEPLDRALLARMVTMHDASGRRIEGDIVVSDEETRWLFVPREAWQAAAYALHVNTELEDLAGNNLQKLFDVAPGDTAATGVSAAVVQVPFRPR